MRLRWRRPAERRRPTAQFAPIHPALEAGPPRPSDSRSSCYCPHGAADKDSGYLSRDEQAPVSSIAGLRLATALARSLLCGIAAKENPSMRLIHTLYEPAGEGPHPTLIAMHGYGANALDLLGLAPYIADGRFLVICPQG